MNRNAVETVMGAVVLVVAAVFLFFAYTTSQVQTVSGYELQAKFNSVDGLKDGGDVRVSGIKVGSIISQKLDPKTFQAVVTVSVDPSVKLATDSIAQITSSGLLGDKYISIEPGNEDDIIPPGGSITHTQAAMNLENLIGQVIYSQGQGGATKKPDAGAAPGAAPGTADDATPKKSDANSPASNP
jgi:phospholipid/cholesterol/gamma-HCH transport system substrate-binding protein